MTSAQPEADVRALHVIPAVAPCYGGPSEAVLSLTRVLADQGVTCCTATTDAACGERLAVLTGTPITYRGMRCIFFPQQASESLKFSLPFARWLNRNVDTYDIVHVHAVFSHPTFAAWKACSEAAVPCVVRPLGTLSPWSMEQRAFRKKLAWHLWGKKMLRYASEIHFTTELERSGVQDILDVAGGRVIPLGVDERYFEPVPDGRRNRGPPTVPDPPYVLFLSRLHPKKRVEVLIEAWCEATGDGTGRSWELWIAGSGDDEYERKLRCKARQQGADSIKWIGWVEGENKRRLFREASLFVLPSRQENFGIAAAEAAASGLPLILTSQVGIAPFVKRDDAGWLVEPDQVRQLAVALGRAMASHDERLRRGENARRMAENRFRWPKVGRRIRSMYDDVIANHRAAGL